MPACRLARRGESHAASNDLWIAASTMEHGTEPFTLDPDFRHVPQILVALHEVGKTVRAG